MNAVVSEAARPKAAGKDFQDVLTFPLYHGDMLIMHGTKIHRYYEVSERHPAKATSY